MTRGSRAIISSLSLLLWVLSGCSSINSARTRSVTIYLIDPYHANYLNRGADIFDVPFDGGHRILSRKVLNEADAGSMVEALNQAIDAPEAGFSSLCFEPSHGIVVVSNDGKESRFGVCLHCWK